MDFAFAAHFHSFFLGQRWKLLFRDIDKQIDGIVIFYFFGWGWGKREERERGEEEGRV